MNKSIIFTVLGASGDLSLKKIFPALYDLYIKNKLPKNIAIIAYSRTEYTHKQYRKLIQEALKKTTDQILLQNKIVDNFLEKIFYCQGQYNKKNDFLKLKKLIHSIYKTQIRSIFYFSIPPQCFESTTKALVEAQFIQKGREEQIVVLEKPFGYDLQSAEKLSKKLRELIEEKQIYRIDHYLGKELIQNILSFRFSNSIFEPIWNKEFIKDITISWQESQGINKRAGYFDQSGIIRDVTQNHLIQILSLIIMDAPRKLTPQEIAKAKDKVLQCIPPITEENSFIAQYTQGISEGQKINAYIEEEKIPKDSKRDTYAFLKLHIQNQRWQGVPIFLRAGKALNSSNAEIIITLKKSNTFKLFPGNTKNNKIILTIQPKPQMSLEINNKFPNTNLLTNSKLNFRYSQFQTQIPNAYERLILDSINNDKSLFISYQELISAWKIFTPILKKIDNKELKLHYYPAGAKDPETLSKFINSITSNIND